MRADTDLPGREPLILLGPQAVRPTLRDALRSLGDPAPVATVTAGWQDREMEDAELDRHLDGRSVNLRLYGRTERVAAADPELARAHRQVQNRLKLLRRAYNVRLAHVMAAVGELRRLDGDPTVLDPEREAALEAVRRLDAQHFSRVAELRADFDRKHDPLARPAVQRERREIEAVLDGVGAVAIAGGHVAVLLNRLRAFGLREPLSRRPLLAWSAGAMALATRVVLFHDSPPQGPGHAEAFDTGLGLFSDLIPLPHGSRRLRIDDRERTARFALRFAPDVCVLLDPGGEVRGGQGRWLASEGVRCLTPAGGLGEPTW